MKKNEKIKLFSLCLLVLFCFFIQTIAYSAINSTMVVSGDAYARVDADVRITGFRLAYVNNATSSFEDFGKNHIITSVDLVSNSSSITYYVEITNYGSTDVGIFDITGLPSEVNYSIKDYNLHDKICDDTGKCNSFIKKTYEITLSSNSAFSGQVQLNFDFRIYHKVTYTDVNVASDSPVEVIDGGNVNITFLEKYDRVIATAWEYMEFTNIIEPNELFAGKITAGENILIENIKGDLVIKYSAPSLKLVAGNINTPGSEVCYKDECFIILYNDGYNLWLTTKYNLYLGGTYDGLNYIEYEEETYMQDSSMLGYTSHSTERNGVISFDEAFSKGGMDFNSNIYEINTEVNRDAFFYPELFSEMFGCIDECDIDASKSCGNVFVCENMPKTLSNTSFWLYPYDGEKAFAYNSVSNSIKLTSIYDNTSYGIRGFIDLRADEVRETFDFTINGTTYKAEEGMTWGDWVDSEYNTGEFVNNNYDIRTKDFYYFITNNSTLSDTIKPNEIIERDTIYILFGGASG